MQLTHLLPFLLGLALAAQDTRPASGDAKAAATLVQKACATMQTLEAVSFKTSEVRDGAMMRRFKKQVPAGIGLTDDEPTEIAGELSHGCLRLSLEDGEQEVVLAGRRTIARKGEGAWKLHHGTTASGENLPYVLDPQQLFEALGALPAEAKKIEKTESTRIGDLEVTLVTLEIGGKEAKQLAKSGLLPRASGGGLMLGGPKLKSEIGESSYDVALWIEPATGNVQRMRVHGFLKDTMAGGVTISFGGADGGGDDDDDADEQKASKEKVVKDGLPVRAKKKDVSEFDLDVTFKGHGEPTPLDLSKEALELLRVR